jgi:hypothetical protein
MKRHEQVLVQHTEKQKNTRQKLQARVLTPDETRAQNVDVRIERQKDTRQKLQARVLTPDETRAQQLLAPTTTPTQQQTPEETSNDHRQSLKARILARRHMSIPETGSDTANTTTHDKKRRTSYKCSKCHKVKKTNCVCKNIKHNMSLFGTIYKAHVKPSAFKLVFDSHAARESHLMLQRNLH